MSTKIEFEIQVRDSKSHHGWRAIGGREGKLYFSEDDRIETRGSRVELLRVAMARIREDWVKNWMKPRDLRIVKIETVVTYEVVE
jgi:hypothetical protein